MISAVSDVPGSDLMGELSSISPVFTILFGVVGVLFFLAIAVFMMWGVVDGVADFFRRLFGKQVPTDTVLQSHEPPAASASERT